MADDDDLFEDGEESGKGLRKKLEAVLKENAELKSVATAAQAKLLIQEKGYKHLTVEDLSGVDLKDLEKKAQEMETQKADADAAALRRVLGAKGFGADEIEQAVKGLLGTGDDADGQDAALDRIRDVARLQGTPPSQIEDKGLTGPELLQRAYATK